MKTLSSDQLDLICEHQLFNLPYFRGMLRAVEMSFYKRMDLSEPILDVGAGDGEFASTLLLNTESVGIDPWWQPLEEAASRRVYTLLSQAKGSEIPFPNSSYSTIISNSVLEHIPDIQPVLNEIARVIKPEGRFVFAVPNHRFRSDLWGVQVLKSIHLKRLADRYSLFFNKVARHYNLDSPDIWIERLNKAGFDKVEFWNYFPVWAMQMLERGHAAGLPNLLWKKVFGKWVLFPSRKNPFLHFYKVRAMLNNPVCEDGTCTFFIARKSA